MGTESSVLSDIPGDYDDSGLWASLMKNPVLSGFMLAHELAQRGNNYE